MGFQGSVGQVDGADLLYEPISFAERGFGQRPKHVESHGILARMKNIVISSLCFLKEIAPSIIYEPIYLSF